MTDLVTIGVAPEKLFELLEPFPSEDVEWRVNNVFAKGDRLSAKVLAYITNRAIMARLDEVCGPQNWRNEYASAPGGGVLCGISINVAGIGWIAKFDGAENTQVEAVKGGLSSAMKRAGVQWGIGRYLYSLEEGWAKIFPANSDSGRFYVGAKQAKNGRPGHPAFRWDPPALPSWALPNHSPRTELEAAIERIRAHDQKLAGDLAGRAKDLKVSEAVRSAAAWATAKANELDAVANGTVGQVPGLDLEPETPPDPYPGLSEIEGLLLQLYPLNHVAAAGAHTFVEQTKANWQPRVVAKIKAQLQTRIAEARKALADAEQQEEQEEQGPPKEQAQAA